MEHHLIDGEPDFLHTHKIVAKVLPVLIREHMRQSGHHPNQYQMDEICAIGREIDLLSPAVDDGKNRPDNSEYPWPSQKEVLVLAPCDWDFRVDQRLRTPSGKLLLKTAFAIIEEFAAS